MSTENTNRNKIDGAPAEASFCWCAYDTKNEGIVNKDVSMAWLQ